MEHPLLSPRSLVADLIASSTLAAAAFLNLRVDCIGCSMNKFCTLEDVSHQYGLSLDAVINELKECVKGSGES